MRDESILYVPSAECYYLLNRSASALWEALEVPSTDDHLAEFLCERFNDVTRDRALNDVRAALRDMCDRSLVEVAGPPNVVGEER